MDDPIEGASTGLAIGGPVGAGVLGGASAIMGGVSAIGRNRAIKESAKNARRATETQIGQVTDAGRLERKKREQAAARILGSIRVAAAEGGASANTGSFGAFIRQTAIDEELDTSIIQTNTANQVNRISSGFAAQLAEYEGATRNPMLDAFTSGLQGAATGLAIGSDIDELLNR